MYVTAQKEKTSISSQEKQYKIKFPATANLSVEKVQIPAISAKTETFADLQESVSYS